MTALEIKPRWADKTARFRGTVAAGEVVAVTVKGAADWINSNALRLRIVNERGDTVAQFPVPDDVYDDETMPANTWGTDGDENEDATCQLSLNTDQMRRCVPRGTRMLLFVLDDPTQGNGILYFKDLCEVTHWPDRTGEDSPAPIDLGNYRNFLREAQDAMEDAADRVEAAETQIATSAENAAVAATAADASQSAAEAAQLAIPAQVEAAIDSADIPGLVASEVEDQLEYKQDSLTDEQMAAVDSGITEDLLEDIQDDIEDLQSGKADASTVAAALALKANASDMETALANKAGNSALSAEVAARASADSTLNAKVTTLIGTDNNMSARDIAQQEVARIVASADADFDTLKEVADWIKSDTTGAAKMQSDIADLKDRNEFTDAEKAKLAGVEAGANAYTLPAATASTLGGVKQGTGVTIAADGTISTTGGGGGGGSDDALTRAEAVAGFTEWTVKRNGVDVTAQVIQPTFQDPEVDEWSVEGSVLSSDGGVHFVAGGKFAESLLWSATEIDSGNSVAYAATRTRLPTMADVDAKLDKTGGTMTGGLIVSAGVNNRAGLEIVNGKVCLTEHHEGGGSGVFVEFLLEMVRSIPYALVSVTPTAGAPFVLAACFPIKYEDTDISEAYTVQLTDISHITVVLNETSGRYEVFDSGFSDMYPVFLLNSDGTYYIEGSDVGDVTFGANDDPAVAGVTQVLGFTQNYALTDRTMNQVVVASPLPENGIALSFPDATAGKVRDFLVRLTIPAGDAPQIAYPEGVTFENADGSFPEINTDESAAASTLLMFTETAPATGTGVNATPARFLVKGEALREVS